MLSRRQRNRLGLAVYALGWMMIALGMLFAIVLDSEHINAMEYFALAALDIGLVVGGLATLHVGVTIRKALTRGTYCPKCEYDLRGNETGRCPECGCRVEPNS